MIILQIILQLFWIMTFPQLAYDKVIGEDHLIGVILRL